MPQRPLRANASGLSIPESNIVASTFDAAVELLKPVRSYIVAIAAVVAIVLALPPLDTVHASVIGALGTIPLVAAFFLQTLPDLRQRRRIAHFKAWAVKSDDRPLNYFRLVAYEDSERDHLAFDRADGAHREVVEFMRKSASPLLYLSGVSGAGKTSLLNAYVIPKLRDGSPQFRIVRIRSGDAPISALREALLQPGTIWKSPKEIGTESAHDLLARAVAHLRRDDLQLLVIFDQFEELAFAREHERQPVEEFRHFLQALKQEPVDGLRILISFRDDYKGLLVQLGLPVLEQNRNWVFISPFSYSAARDFLTGGFAHLGSDVLTSVLREAEFYEDSPGQFRPITLNMIGRMLQRRPEELSAREAERSLEGDLRHLLRNDFHGRLVLDALISERGTRRSRTVGEIAAELNLEPAVVEGICSELQVKGLTRRLARSENVSDRAWEISHDFVARLLVTVLRHSRPTARQRIRPWLFPAALVTMAIGVALVLWHYQTIPARAADRLREAGGRVFGAANSGWTVEYTFDGRDAAARWQRAADDLKLLKPMRLLTIVNPPFRDCKTLGMLTDLESLRLLSRTEEADTPAALEFASLAGIEKLAHLRCLEIRNLHITDLSPIGSLRSLQTLVVVGCDRLQAFPDFDLEHLLELQVRGCSELADVRGIGEIASLRRLALVGSDHVRDVPLARLVNLEHLDLNGSDGFTTLPLDVQALSRVLTFDLNGCNGLQIIRNLGDMKSLTELNLEECQALELDDDSFDNMRQLAKVNLNRCERITAAVVARLPNTLTHLNICRIPIDESAVQAILRMKSLKQLSVQGDLPDGALQRISGTLPDCKVTLVPE